MKHTKINDNPIWQALEKHRQRIADESLLDRFESDPKRITKFTFESGGILADFSKQRVDGPTMQSLLELAESVALPAAIESMFNGQKINRTEDRAVLHVALRGSVSKKLVIDGVNVSDAVETELNRMLKAADTVARGEWRGFTGEPVTDVVHIGIGGSDLGPRMITKALTPLHQSKVNVHFVANIDANELLHTLSGLTPQRTLFLIASKSFGTEETLCNAALARRWIVKHLGDEKAVAKHMLALSSNAERVKKFGISADNRFEFWDWVGGRFSVWSVIGMPIAIAIGSDAFRQLLAGAGHMDQHFRTSPFERNLPVLLALIGIWNRNFLDYPSQAVVPYYHFLDLLPQYLQQAEMESNGKRVTLHGEPLPVSSAPVIWGTAGTDAQHAYFQMLHQGTDVVPVDFVVIKRCNHRAPDSHQRLLAHAFAQSEALLRGRTVSSDDPLASHQYCPGNRPSTTLLLETASAYNIGALIALYEHKIFVQGRILGINSFDQFGVELGKQLAQELLPMVQASAPVEGRDASTLQLIRLCISENA